MNNIDPLTPSLRRSDRDNNDPYHYYAAHLDGADADEVARTKVDVLRKRAFELGFNSLFEVFGLEAKMSDEFYTFVESGGLEELYREYCRLRKPRSEDIAKVHRTICAPAIDIFKREWKALTTDTSSFKIPLNNFSPEYVAEFNFESIFKQMQKLAPCLIDLLQQLAEKPPSSMTKEDTEDLRRRAEQRHITMALAILANHVSQRFNVIQGRVGYFLFASKTSKSVISVLNKLGVCPSYDGIIDSIKATADAARDYLSRVCLRGQAIWISFDNLTYAANVKLQTLFNRGDFIIVTAGYLVIPPESRARPMFTPLDCDYRKLKTLSLGDFLPSTETKAIMTAACRSILWDVFKSFAGSNKVVVPNLIYPMPIVFPLNHLERSEILSLPTYPFNEGIINEVIDIHECIANDIGMSDKQRMENMIMFKGDFATVRQNRRARKRQSKCSPEKRLSYIESTAGLFHLQVQVLAMLFFTHLGLASDNLSIARWIIDLDKDEQKIWSKEKTNVKDFRACMDLFDVILDGYIIAFIAEYCGIDQVPVLLSSLDQIGPEKLVDAIENLTSILNDFSLVSRMRKRDSESRDEQYENIILFMQQGLVLRNFALAMRTGDSGMVIECLSYFTVWFQATNKINYASETIHLTACIKKLWSPEMKQYWMENCLINPSGKKEGWMACDYLGEYIVGQVKAMMHQNVNAANDKFLRETISPLILNFLNMRRHMMRECDVPYSSYHSTKVETRFDIEHVAQKILEGQFSKELTGRTARNAVDLHGAGIKALSTHVGIQKYIFQTQKDRGYVRPIWEEEPSEEDSIEIEEDGDGQCLVSNDLDDWLDE